MFRATGKEYYKIYDVNSVLQTMRKFASQQGYYIYPHEISVYFHGFADLACMNYHEKLYAFEIKEKGDSISTGIEQCKGYQSSFDYVYLAGTVKPRKETLMRLERLGIGYVQCVIDDSVATIHCLCKAPLNHPIPKQRESVLQRFKKMRDKMVKARGEKTQNSLSDFVEAVQ